MESDQYFLLLSSVLAQVCLEIIALMGTWRRGGGIVSNCVLVIVNQIYL